MKELLRFILGLLAPFILIFGGAGLAATGAEFSFNVLIWTGGICVLAGLLWGCWLLLLDGTFTWWK